MNDFRINNFLIHKCADLYAEIIKLEYPADKIIEKFYKQNHSLGKRDRKFITETIYAVLRNYRILECAAKKINDNAPLVIIYCYLTGILNIPKDKLNISFEYYNLLKETYNSIIKRIETMDDKIEKTALKYSKPNWFTELVVNDYGFETTQKILDALNTQAPLIIRTNTIKISKNELKNNFKINGFENFDCKLSPDALRLENGANLFKTEMFKNGLFEVQDEGSQLISYLAVSNQAKKIFDGCAGGGGKTLHLSALMKNKGLIYASDINPSRLANLKKRAQRSGSSNIKIIPLQSHFDRQLKKYREFFDAVLIDAPCSGTGVLRRNPDSIMKMNMSRINELTALQTEILQSYSRLVKNGGILIYATCSILALENEKIIFDFLKKNKQFKLKNANDILLEKNIKIDSAADNFLRLNPYMNNTDGFFAAVMKKENTCP